MKTDTYLDLREISKVSPREPLSPAKTIDNLVYMYKSLLPKKVVSNDEDKSKTKRTSTRNKRSYCNYHNTEDYMNWWKLKPSSSTINIDYAMGYWELWAK